MRPESSEGQGRYGKSAESFLAYGNYADELPAPSERLKSQVLAKMASASGIWQDRQVQTCSSIAEGFILFHTDDEPDILGSVHAQRNVLSV